MYRKFDVTENLFFWNSTFLVELNTAEDAKLENNWSPALIKGQKIK
jgi:hypothetical protein